MFFSCFFRGLAGQLDLFLRPAGAEQTPTAFFEFFVWMAELVAMASGKSVCLRGTAELLDWQLSAISVRC